MTVLKRCVKCGEHFLDTSMFGTLSKCEFCCKPIKYVYDVNTSPPKEEGK